MTMIKDCLKKNIVFMLFILFIILHCSPTATAVETQAEQVTLHKAVPAANSYRADIAVTGLVQGSGGRRVNLTLTVRELGDSSLLGSVLVLLPDLNGSAGFSNFRINGSGSTASSGKRWEAMIDERSGTYFLNLRAKSVSDYLGKNEQVSVSFSANVPAYGNTGAYQFKTRAWTDNSSRDSLRVNPANGLPENLNSMASGFNDPVIHVELPGKTGSNSYYFTTDRARGLTAELYAEGSGFQTTIFSSANSVAYLTILQLPAMHHYTTTAYRPDGNGGWSVSAVAENQPVDLLQGYTADWRSYYHRVPGPGKKEVFTYLAEMLKAQQELQGYNLSGLGDDDLKALANWEGITYYRTELTPHSEQVWFAGVALEPGAKGVLMKRIDSAYGTTAYVFNENDELWPSGRGYRGPDHGFGFVRDGDGYRVERGRDYPGSYVDIEQVADASKGTVTRYIDVSSPFSGAYLREDMTVSGSGKVDEILRSVNIRAGAFLDWPGSAAFSDDWDLWVFPNRSSGSAVFNAPASQPQQQGGSGSSSSGSAAGIPVQDDSDLQSEQESEAPEDSSEEEIALVLPPQPGNSSREETAPAEPGVDMVEYAAELSRDNKSVGITLLVIIGILVLITITAIVIVIRKR